MSHPIFTLIADHVFGTKDISNRFYTQALPKIIEIKFLNKKSVQQDYLQELYPSP